jgi:hypothetical protein
MALFRRRPGYIYGIKVVHEDHGRVVLGYLGKTRQYWRTRVAQHETQPWADLIVKPYVIKAGSFTDLGLWWAEVWRIVVRRPVYNYEWNRCNPRRIPIFTARERSRSERCRRALRSRVRPVRFRTTAPATTDPFTPAGGRHVA